MDRVKNKARPHNLNIKRSSTGKDSKKGRKKFVVSPHGKKHRDERIPRSQATLCKDPLNLAALIGKGGSDSPQNSSPVVERSHDFEPADVVVTNVSDPLHLDLLQNEEIPSNPKNSAKKKRKRKRRHTYHGEDLGDRAGNEEACSELKVKKPQQNGDLESLTSGDEVFSEHDTPTKNSFGKHSSDTEGTVSSKRMNQESTSDNHLSRKVSNSKKQLHFKVTEKATKASKRFRSQDEKFKYGNYNRYYGYRNPNMSEDARIPLIQREWIFGKDCLDIGCNVGHVSLWIARHMHPKTMVGIDIDTGLIKAAQNNIRHYLPTRTQDAPCQSDFPISFALCHGPLAAPVCVTTGGEKYGFPYNVTFYQENYVPQSEKDLAATEQRFDTVLCLSVTKWVHLNWGDEGLKRMFKKIYMHLRPGGRFLLEPQPFKSYKKKKNISPEIRANYDAMKLLPDKFIAYLLSKEVGFATSEVIDNSQAKVKGFQRPIYVLTKSQISGKKAES